MTDRELMQQALHTLEGWANHGEWVWPESALEQAKRNTTESIAALRERLAQARQWQGLTEAEIKAPIQRAMQYFGYDSTQYSLGGAATIGFLGLVKEIEAKLKEKNA